MVGTHSKIGLHIETSGAVSADILNTATRLHAAGKPLASVVVLDDIALANNLARVVRYVVFRSYPHGQMFDPSKCDTPQHAGQHADYIYDQHWPVVSQLVGSNIYVQFRNEKSEFPDDNYFELELAMRSDRDGRFKVGMFADSLGSPTVSQWETREAALSYAMLHQHIAILHEYGAEVNNQPAHVPMSDANTFPWYGGRHRMLYDACPANCRPNLIIGECGCSDGRPDSIDDIKAYNALLQADSYVLGFCIWGFGHTDKLYDANSMLPALEALVLSL